MRKVLIWRKVVIMKSEGFRILGIVHTVYALI